MAYTLWSHGALLGETDLAMEIAVHEGARAGPLRPTPAFDALIPLLRRIEHASSTMMARVEALGRAPTAADTPTLLDPETARESTAAQHELRALELELRDEAGTRVFAEWDVFVAVSEFPPRDAGIDLSTLTPAQLARVEADLAEVGMRIGANYSVQLLKLPPLPPPP